MDQTKVETRVARVASVGRGMTGMTWRLDGAHAEVVLSRSSGAANLKRQNGHMSKRCAYPADGRGIIL